MPCRMRRRTDAMLNTSTDMNRWLPGYSNIGRTVSIIQDLASSNLVMDANLVLQENSQVEGIIPPDIPLEERKPEDLTAEEARELIRRMRAQGQTSEIKCDPAMQDMKPVKQQHFIILDDDDDKGGEGSSSASASRGNSMKTEIEIVDLTDD